MDKLKERVDALKSLSEAAHVDFGLEGVEKFMEKHDLKGVGLKIGFVGPTNAGTSPTLASQCRFCN